MTKVGIGIDETDVVIIATALMQLEMSMQVSLGLRPGDLSPEELHEVHERIEDVHPLATKFKALADPIVAKLAAEDTRQERHEAWKAGHFDA